jgi:hypothetical protein
MSGSFLPRLNRKIRSVASLTHGIAGHTLRASAGSPRPVSYVTDIQNDFVKHRERYRPFCALVSIGG